MRSRAAAALLVAALVTGACSSTTKSGPSSSAESVETGTSEPGKATASVAASTRPGAPRPRSSAGTQAEPSPPDDTFEVDTSVPSAGLTGRGVTAKTVKVGIRFDTDLSTAYKVVGFSPETDETVDERPIIDALVKYINKNGGIAGRKLIPVYSQQNATSGTNASVAQSVCSQFVEDEKVFIGTSGHVGGDDSLANCMAAGHTPLVQQNQWPYDSVYYRKLDGYLYQPSRLRGDRYATAYIDGLHRRGYFDKGGKIGLLRFDAPVFERLAAIMKKRLARYGLKLTDEVAMSTYSGASSLGQINGQLGNAILRFRANMIDHVIFDEYAGIVPFFMVTQAESQGYRPRYGLSSVNLPGTVQQQAPEGQLDRAVAVSWLPSQDVRTEQDPRKRGASAECMNAIKKNGVANPSRLYAQTHCDNLFFVRDVLARITSFTPAGFAKAADSLGSAWHSPNTFTSRMAAGHHDGATSVRGLLFNDGCQCFKYAAGSTEVP